MSVKAEHLRTPEEALGMPQVQVSELAHRVPRCTPEVKILEPSSFLCILLSTKFHADKNPRESHLSCYDQGLSPRHKSKYQIVSLWFPAQIKCAHNPLRASGMKHTRDSTSQKREHWTLALYFRDITVFFGTIKYNSRKYYIV